jgi:anti-anti-sigma regulatory factor
MQVFPNSLLIEPAATALLPVSLVAIDATLLARMLLQPHPQLLIDCQAQPCRRNVGVCYFLSQLLLLRQRGASVWLCNVDARLRSHLRQLGLESVFFLAD